MHAFGLEVDSRISLLSFGARTKLALLLALSRRPEVLVLDEPTTGLDPVSKQEVFGELLRAVEGGERSVLISSHGLTDIERFADHVGMLKDGKLLLEGRTDEIVDRSRLAEFFTDTPVSASAAPAGLVLLRHAGGRHHALLDQTSGAADWLRARDVRELSLTRLTLEDLFMALVKENTPAAMEAVA
jgi:ABC-2 type transport system ATP-binding protein